MSEAIVPRSLVWATDVDVPRSRGPAAPGIPGGPIAEQSGALLGQPAACSTNHMEVVIRALDPVGDAELWDAVVEVQVASRDERESEDEHREFSRTRQGDLRRF